MFPQVEGRFQLSSLPVSSWRFTLGCGLNVACLGRKEGNSTPPGPPGRTSKYRALTLWLGNQPEARIQMTFPQLEAILRFRLPASSRRYLAHWSSSNGSAVAKAFHEAGWKATNVNLVAERLTFEREL